MRQIVLDTETTGLDPTLGHRVIEIGGVELINRRPTSNNFHALLNPERDIDMGATNVHGRTWDELKTKPRFADVAHRFIDFVRDSELLIHNAAFDVAFIDAELALLGLPPLREHGCIVNDTLRMARELHPGKRNNLDVLCERYQVNNSARTLHGALLDAELLAEVYLAMTRGQESLMMAFDHPADRARASRIAAGAGARPALVILRATDAESNAHVAYVVALDRDSGGKALWSRTDPPSAATPTIAAEPGRPTIIAAEAVA